MNKKSLIIILAFFIAVVVLAAAIYVVAPESFQGLKKSGGNAGLTPEKPKVIEEELTIPETQKITGGEGRFVNEGPVAVPLVPKTEAEKVVVSKAVLTVKGSYDLAVSEAKNWASDAKLVFVKSLGAVTLEGKSSQWQMAFSSKTKLSKGYEIIIQGDEIVSKKEIDSSAVGAILPTTFKDSGTAVVVLQELPQYSDASLSAISLYYNTDGKIWRYTLMTSKGSVSTAAQ